MSSEQDVVDPHFDEEDYTRNRDILRNLGIAGFDRDHDGTIQGWTPEQVKGLRANMLQATKRDFTRARVALNTKLSLMSGAQRRTLARQELFKLMRQIVMTDKFYAHWALLDCPYPRDIVPIGPGQSLRPRAWRRVIVEEIVRLTQICDGRGFREAQVVEARMILSQALTAARVYRAWMYNELPHKDRPLQGSFRHSLPSNQQMNMMPPPVVLRPRHPLPSHQPGLPHIQRGGPSALPHVSMQAGFPAHHFHPQATIPIDPALQHYPPTNSTATPSIVATAGNPGDNRNHLMPNSPSNFWPEARNGQGR